MRTDQLSPADHLQTTTAFADAEPPEMWPATYPPQGEDAELPWLPTDPIPNPEPEAPGLDMPVPAMYQAAAGSTSLLR